MLLTRSAHEEALAQLVRKLDARGLSEASGIHGPDCIAWRVSAEVCNFLGAGCAVLMQLAHPYVAQGIMDHSTALSNVQRRFVGTFESIYRMTFGTRAEALASARTLFQVHSRVHGVLPQTVGVYLAGHRYHANEVGALRWVYATLASTAMQVHSVAGLGLGRDDLAEFYRESANFAALFGLTDTELPATLSAFEHYVEAELESSRIVVTDAARTIARHLLTAPTPSLRPAFTVYRAVTAKFLAPQLRRAYDLPFGAREAAIARLALTASTPLRSLSPEGLRLMPDAMRAEARLGLRRPSRLTPVLEKALLVSLEAWD